MKRKYKYMVGIALLSVIGLFVVSCQKEETADESTDRLFTPVRFSASVGGTRVKLSWIPIRDATYLVQISRDSLLFEEHLQTFYVDNADQLEIGDLLGTTLYSARIKAVSQDPEIGDSHFNQITFKTGEENIFIKPKPDDITASSVLLSWKAGAEVTKITVTATDFEQTHTLTLEEIAAGQKLVDNLEPDQTYAFGIYYDNLLRGTLSVKTSPAP